MTGDSNQSELPLGCFGIRLGTEDRAQASTKGRPFGALRSPSRADRIPGVSTRARGKWLATTTAALLLALAHGCGNDASLLLDPRNNEPIDATGLTLLARFVHISDTHVMDEESPARFEAYSTQLFDGVIRTANRIHASGRTVNFLVHTGDACDNAQGNELDWMLGIFDGETIDPLTGPDDRPPAEPPDPLVDPHAAFQAQGLYRAGRHGNEPTIPWYTVLGNHDVFAQGILPIFAALPARRIAPLPFDQRPGLVLPVVFDPTGRLAYGRVTPADPGPPRLLEIPRAVTPNRDRRFFNKREFIDAMFTTVTGPAGHGFDGDSLAPSWYSVTPAPGVRLIGLDTCDPAHKVPGLFYADGAVSAAQVLFLKRELAAARDAGELVIIASHHPSRYLRPLYGTALDGPRFRDLLNRYPNVLMHLAGHSHVNRVYDRGGYLEIETCSTLDLPQEARVIEIWRRDGDDTHLVAYEMLSHLDDELPPLGDDPLIELRRRAYEIAVNDPLAKERQRRIDPLGADSVETSFDRRGRFMLRGGSPAPAPMPARAGQE